MNAELIAELKKIAKRKCWCDEEYFIPDDYAGGNMDDAYAGGYEDGRAEVARTVLEALGISYE